MGIYIVSCVNRYDSPEGYPCIEGIGGLSSETGRRWYMPAEEAIAHIQARTHEFVVIVGGRDARLVVATHPLGHPCLKTSADGQLENALLLRPHCPVSEMRPDAV